MGKWKYGTNSLQIFSKLEMFIYQQDRFGNLVPGSFPFDARVVEKATNLSVPVGDLSFQEVGQGVRLLSFIVSEPGGFVLTIFSLNLNKSIANVPYHYTVFVGMKSIEINNVTSPVFHQHFHASFVTLQVIVMDRIALSMGQV